MRALFVCLLAACLAGCTGPYSNQPVSAKEQQPALKVKTQRVVTTNIPEIVAANGELFAEEQATVTSKIPGRISRLLVDLGSQVAAGQVIAELDPGDEAIRMRQADALVQQTRARLGLAENQGDDEVRPLETAMVREADAQLKEARFIFDTTERLAKEGVVSRIDLEKAGVRRQAAEAHRQTVVEGIMQLRAQLVERRAQLAQAKQNMDDLIIRAPFPGAVTKRIASLGEYLPANAPVVTVVRQNPVRIRVEVPERLAAKIHAGQRIDVSLSGGLVKRSGRVVRLSPAIEAQSRSLTVEGELPNADGALRPGTFAEAVIVVNPNADGIAAPASALISFAGTERMFVVKNGALDERLIRTARRLPGERIEVLEGLQDGDLLVTDATDRMVKGMKVTVTERAEAR
jgi:RND family efflux transporter MFP subunit